MREGMGRESDRERRLSERERGRWEETQIHRQADGPNEYVGGGRQTENRGGEESRKKQRERNIIRTFSSV